MCESSGWGFSENKKIEPPMISFTKQSYLELLNKVLEVAQYSYDIREKEHDDFFATENIVQEVYDHLRKYYKYSDACSKSIIEEIYDNELASRPWWKFWNTPVRRNYVYHSEKEEYIRYLFPLWAIDNDVSFPQLKQMSVEELKVVCAMFAPYGYNNELSNTIKDLNKLILSVTLAANDTIWTIPESQYNQYTKVITDGQN